MDCIVGTDSVKLRKQTPLCFSIGKKMTQQEFEKIPELMDKRLKAPFPYFGGKGRVADRVWRYLGDVKQYIEPFFGSGAVLLKRPPTKLDKIYEIVNDKDGWLCNAWRAIQFSPDEVARWCDWPVNHADLIARKKVLIDNEQKLLDGLQNDPEWHDAKLAGYWVWATSCWIGTGMLCPNQIPHLTDDKGITSQIPHLTRDRGITTRDRGIYERMNLLSKRLRYVKVVCGDWTRVCGGNWQDKNKPVGMFFDPPYATMGRDKNIYFHDSLQVGKDVEKWALERGKNPNYRIVVCGYEDEYKTLLDSGWIFEKWSTGGGYANRNSKGRGMLNRHRERLFISPHCLKIKKTRDGQMTLFEVEK